MISSAFRLRRYRVLAIFLLVAIFLFYNSSSISKTRNFVSPAESWRKAKESDAKSPVKPGTPPTKPADDEELEIFKPPGRDEDGSGIRFDVNEEDLGNKPKAKPSPKADDATPTIPEKDISHTHHDYTALTDGRGQGRNEVEAGTNSKVIHWKKTPEHYPVPKESMIPLPKGKPLDLPKIQFNFEPETEKDRKERHRRQGAIKDSFRHAWDGYRKYAWGHDEVSPVSKSYRDPFAGWAATLVDALDSMAIMGLHREFTEALGHVEKIDFTTTTRPEIPMFETTIRYLGGFLGAYDVTGHKHPILLEKAVELGDVLYSAFDTPNRMPKLYFQWQPSAMAGKSRAGTRVVMSELGSLSVEFTRLAQLTGDNKYFDAIQRITDAFEEAQMKMSLPGLWPLNLDASGCKEVDEEVKIPNPLPGPAAASEQKGAASDEKVVQQLPPPPAAAVEQPERKPLGGGTVSSEERVLNPDSSTSGHVKRQEGSLADSEPHDEAGKALKEASKQASPAAPAPPAAAAAVAPVAAPAAQSFIITTKRVCKDQGLVAPAWGIDRYTLGGQADSTYEYLPKEYLLLGGLKDQYRTMYENSYKAFKEHLFFKPLAPKNPDMLVSGSVTLNTVAVPPTERFTPEGSHLTCFVGGMVGLGAKLFKHPEQLDDAKRITEGCVWNYFSTATGIMPEVFEMHHCKGKEPCRWDENEWLSRVSPPPDAAIEAAKARGIPLKNPWHSKRELSEIEKRHVEPELQRRDNWEEEEVIPHNVRRKKKHRPVAEDEEQYAERPARERHSFAEDSEDYDEPRRHRRKKSSHRSSEDEGWNGNEENIGERQQKANDAYDKWFILAKEMVGNMRLPPGYTSIKDTRYILRPEAIESVFYMYRITGDKEWQEKGWRMWEAVEKYTKTHTAHSAINDVTSKSPTQLDEMESFWLAETLKYFYLLFAEPEVISLDDWVLNTEAHPFLRPKAVAHQKK